MQDDRILVQVQKTIEEMLVDFDSYCRTYGIRYYLFYGSALGAVRHKGFIPWDDDADLILFRKDFEKLKKTWKDHPMEGYFFQTRETDPGYPLKTPKIRKNGTAYVEELLKEKKMHHGIFIDFFVLDDYVKNPLLRSITEWITMFDFNAVRRYQPKRRGKYLYAVTNRLFANGKIYRWWYRSVYPKLKKDETMCSDINSFTFSHRYDFKKEWFGEPKKVPFDAYSLPVPQNTDAVLKVCYGDYMTPPPVKKRVSYHQPYYCSFKEEYHPGK
ncbi:LicD family protein [Fusicatenibacter sp.]